MEKETFPSQQVEGAAVPKPGFALRFCRDTGAGTCPGAVDEHEVMEKLNHTYGCKIEERGAHLNRHHTEVCGRGNSINRNV